MDFDEIMKFSAGARNVPFFDGGRARSAEVFARRAPCISPCGAGLVPGALGIVREGVGRASKVYSTERQAENLYLVARVSVSARCTALPRVGVYDRMALMRYAIDWRSRYLRLSEFGGLL